MNHSGCFSNVWQYVDKVHYNSQDLLNWAKYWGAPPNINSSYISAAVNDEFILTDISKFSPVREDGKIHILTIARLHWKKGLDTALYAIKKLVESQYKVNYVIIGNGPEIEKIRYLIITLNLESVVKIQNFIPHGDVINYIDSSDLVLIPSIQEGCSNFALEAQARGKFCIVTDSEGMSQVVVDNITGKIVKRGDYSDIKDQIINYINLPEVEKIQIAEKAINRIKDDFTRTEQIQKWEQFFNF